MADDKKPSNYDEVMDAKMLEKKDAAYNAADSTPPNPAPLYMTKTPGGKRMVSTPASTEPGFVDTQSPIKAFKGYPR